MKINKATEDLLRGGENERVEFLPSIEPLKAIARVVCAFLNGKGGSIILGVDENGAITEKYTERDVEKIRHFLHDNIVPQTLYTVNLDYVENGKVITVDVPPGRDRPYVFEGSVYIRGKPSNIEKASPDIMRALVEDKARETERWERRPSLELDVDDLDTVLIRQTVRNAEMKRGYSFTDSKNIPDVLQDLSLWRFGQITQAADVLFGKRVWLRLPQTRVRAVCYKTNKGDDYIDDQLFEGPALKLLDDGMAFLKRHISVMSEFSPETVKRDSRSQYPFFSLREGLVNALVHRDYAGFSGGVTISIYPGRVEIWNSGNLPEGITEKDLAKSTHASILVNPDICHVFFLHELMERVGRGTFKIVQECREFGMRPPIWKDEPTGVRLTFHARKGPFLKAPDLNERQKKLLKELALGAHINQRRYVEMFNISERQARRDLTDLSKSGFLSREGKGPSTRYIRTGKKSD